MRNTLIVKKIYINIPRIVIFTSMILPAVGIKIDGLQLDSSLSGVELRGIIGLFLLCLFLV